MVKFNIPTAGNPNLRKYQKDDLELARCFSKSLYKELGNFLKGIILFGSAARRDKKKSGDVDILIVINDISVMLTPEVVEAYRIITEKIVKDVSPKIHVTSLKFTAFWEYIRNGDPIAVNLLRDGVPIIDSGFFEPLQFLLKKGRIRPTTESIWTYFTRAPMTLNNSRWHLTQATLDLYWAVIDAAHAALMKTGEIPPSPQHVSDMLHEKLVKVHKLEKKYSDTMKKFYKLMKMITHREIKGVTGSEYERYYKEAAAFVHRMQVFIKNQ